MNLNHYKKLLPWCVTAIVALCAAIVLYLCTDNDRDTDHRINGMQHQQKIMEGFICEPCSDLPTELQSVLDRFPAYDGKHQSARFIKDIFKLIDVWRLDDASKEMFEYASLDNRLVRKTPEKVDDIFWNIPLPWWTPYVSKGSLYAASPGNWNGSMEGLYDVLMFDSKNSVIYGLSIYNH